MTSKFISSIRTAVIACALPMAVSAAPDPNFHIYLLLGQSNMQGAAHLPDDPISHSRVRVLQGQNCQEHSIRYGEWRDHFQPIIRCQEGTRQKPDGSTGPIGLSPADTFGVTMADANPGVTIGLAGAAYGGTDIQAHLPNCSQYNACRPPYGDVSGAPVVNGTTPIYEWALDLGKRAQEVGVIKGFIMHHGENNSGEEQWLSFVNQYITALRNDLGLEASESPLIVGELPRTGCCTGHNSIVQRIGTAVDNAHWVSSGPMEDGTILGDRSDSLHWSTFSVIEMGKRYAAKMLEVGDFGPLDCGTEGNVPICCNISADPDKDGWGEQNEGEQCVVTEDTKGWHPPNPADVAVAINVGGSGDAVEFDGIWFEADSNVTGGTPHSTTDSVSGANGSSVYASERYGDFSYQIPLENGSYTVQFGMVEMYQTAADARVFHVSAEGSRVISNMDVYLETGHDSLFLSDAFPVQVSDGQLNIEVETVTDNGTLSSILVRRTGVQSSSSSSSSVSSSVPSSSSSSSSSSSEGSGTVGGVLSGMALLWMSAGLLLFRRKR